MFGTKTLASIVKNLFEREILYLDFASTTLLTPDRPSSVHRPPTTNIRGRFTGRLGGHERRRPVRPCIPCGLDGGDSRMMPDMTQQGQPAVQTPSAPAVPVVLFNGVSKSYGRIHALSNITLGLERG